MTALLTDLKRLGEMRAPDGFAERVLMEAGIADSYASFETVLGEVYVAWNRLGVSAAARCASAAEFEAMFIGVRSGVRSCSRLPRLTLRPRSMTS